MHRTDMQFVDFCKTHMIYMKSANQFFPAVRELATRNYTVKLRSHLSKKFKIKTTFSCGDHHPGPDAEVILSCLVSDAASADCHTDCEEFIREMGYNESIKSYKKGQEVFEACKKARRTLNKLFTSSQLTDLEHCYDNY